MPPCSKSKSKPSAPVQCPPVQPASVEEVIDVDVSDTTDDEDDDPPPAPAEVRATAGGANAPHQEKHFCS